MSQRNEHLRRRMERQEQGQNELLNAMREFSESNSALRSKLEAMEQDHKTSRSFDQAQRSVMERSAQELRRRDKDESSNAISRIQSELDKVKQSNMVCDILLVLLTISMVLAFATVRASGEERKKANSSVQATEVEQAQTAIVLPALNTLENARITFYCPCAKCCGKSDGITSSGVLAQAGVTVATDPAVIPTGSQVQVGGHWYTAQDTGVTGAAVDVFVGDHQTALKLGVKTETVHWRQP